jgi:tetratricopeptide (TPR) repeat protein
MQQQILDALRRGAHDDAAALARQALADAPRDVGLLRAAALALRTAGDRDGALAAIDAALADAPDEAELHFLRAGMLLDARDLEAAQAALSQTVALDPNQFGAYVMRAQMAIGRGDLDEAEQQQKLAERVAPEHPWTTMLAGAIASRRGDHDRALGLLSHASSQAPEDLQVLHALAFGYLAAGHLAFAEQAFRRVIEQTGQAPLRGLLAQIVLQQGRPADAADVIAEILADPAQVTPAWQTLGGELELEAGRPERAAPLLHAAFAAHPESRRATNALVQLWSRTDAADDARSTLDAALAAAPEHDHLWLARLAFEPFAGEAARGIVERWNARRPDHLPALQARLSLETGAGDMEAAEAVARAVTALQPGHAAANEFLFNQLLARDPDAAVTFAEGLQATAHDAARLMLRRWVGLAQDAAGRHADAVATWTAVSVETSAAASAPPEPTAAPAQWPPVAESLAPQPPAVFLYGPPGAQVDRVAGLLRQAVRQFRADRFAGPVADAFQDTRVPARLAAGEFTARQIVDSWRTQLPARDAGDGAIVDWLPWWDNAWLLALRPELPQARLLLALRDPRDMLLEWLAFGTALTMRIEDAQGAADWLARHLAQFAELIEQPLMPVTIVRTDAPAADPMAVSAALGEALALDGFPVPPPQALGPDRLPAGRWRAYTDALAGPIAALTPVAVRLGYPQA